MWREFHERLSNLLNDVLASNPRVLSISSRVKSLESIRDKLKRKNLRSTKDLQDIVGFRVVVNAASDIKHTCDVIASQFGTKELAVLSGDRSDVISSAFPGEKIFQKEAMPYEAAHLVLTVNGARAKLPEWRPFRSLQAEVQIITSFGNAWREAEHAWLYKRRNEEEAPPDIANLKVVVRLTTILEKFRRLIERSDVHEKRDIHPFIDEYPFILHPNPVDVFSEVAIGLGTQYRIDFLIRESDGSYLLVELENVRQRLFTKDGDFTQEVNHAQRQVEDWQQWIEANLPMVQKQYPDIVSPKGLIVIGRNQGLTQDQKARLARRNVNLRGRLAIWTYDDLLGNAHQFIESLRRNLSR